MRQSGCAAELIMVVDLIFWGAVSASSARRNFQRYREQYIGFRERFTENFNAAIGVLTASKNGGYALI
jgi:hypothetical protein